MFYMLWGRQAQKFEDLINVDENYVHTDAHPSPLAGTNFLKTKCFSTCNKYLKMNGKKEIDWNVHQK